MTALWTDPQAWAALITLSALEIVLGIDNVVFISLLVARLDAAQRLWARRLGLSLALVFRIALLFGLTWLIGLSAPVFTVKDNAFSWHDIVLIAGGLFLIAKATREMHSAIEGNGDERAATAGRMVLSGVVMQVVAIDLIFSIDSIITAIGMAQDIRIMIAAVLIAVAIMYAASGPVTEFITAHPSTKMLALAFLLLIGVALVADGFGAHVPRGYIYFAMAFSAAVEAANILAQRRRERRRK